MKIQIIILIVNKVIYRMNMVMETFTKMANLMETEMEIAIMNKMMQYNN